MRVMRTSKLSSNASAIYYKAPRRTLKTENNYSKYKLWRKTVLSPQQEKELSKKIIRLAQTE